jgi:hypothetical protein
MDDLGYTDDREKSQIIDALVHATRIRRFVAIIHDRRHPLQFNECGRDDTKTTQHVLCPCSFIAIEENDLRMIKP